VKTKENLERPKKKQNGLETEIEIVYLIDHGGEGIVRESTMLYYHQGLKDRGNRKRNLGQKEQQGLGCRQTELKAMKESLGGKVRDEILKRSYKSLKRRIKKKGQGKGKKT